nr:prolow-density lipoprotein receptor-related protein 1-like [Cherax quadricarinatus]
MSDPKHFLCKSGTCLPREAACDGKDDCGDGSDEGGRCNETCKNCAYNCVKTPLGPRCSCLDGFKITSSGSCEDVDECQGNVSVCDHFCNNLKGSYQCQCHPQYELQPDNATCITKSKEPASLFFAQEKGVRLLSLDESFYRQIVTSDEVIVALAYDPEDKILFWSSQSGVYKVLLDSNNLPRIVINKGTGPAEGLMVDWLGRNLYITDPTNKHILACSLNGENCYSVVVEYCEHPRAIQLDMRKRYMYWTDVQLSLIGKAGMDGSDRINLVTGLHWPNALALDQPAERLYWLDARMDNAFSIKTDGTDRKHLLEAPVNHPFALGVWNQYLYWTDWNHDHIRSGLKRTGKHLRTVIKGSVDHKYYGLIIYHPEMLYQGPNPCSQNPCSHLCLLSPTTPSGYSCACPAYVMKLGPDQRTCLDEDYLVYTLAATESRMFKIFPRVYGRLTVNEWDYDTRLTSIGDFNYEPTLEMVVVSDIYNEVIYGVSVDTGIFSVLVKNTRAVGLAVDWLRSNLYWVDGKKAVEMARLQTGAVLHRTLAVKDLLFPSDVAVAPLLGLLYVCGNKNVYEGYIMSCGLDGSNCQEIVTDNIISPVSLVFDRDPDIRKLYWVDFYKKTIESTAADGSARQELVSIRSQASTGPVSVMATSMHLMWSTGQDDSIFSVLKVNLTLLKSDALGLGFRVSKGLKLTEIGWKIPASVLADNPACRSNNGNCSQLCVANSTSEKVCICEYGFVLDHDNLSCSPVSCSDHLFKCAASNTCIPFPWRCDGVPDCHSGEDELECEKERICSSTEFRCTSGACISGDWKCDGMNDCYDGGDEKLPECSKQTCAGQWQCTSGECIPFMWVCDKIAECRDGSDELNCSSTCQPNKFTCQNGDCIPDKWRCDGDADCQDGSDEAGCAEKCGIGQFTCHNLRCVPLKDTCDGDDDCGDGSDERLPSCTSTTPSGTSPVCPNGFSACKKEVPETELVCIPHTHVCNGEVDCPLKDDEECSECHDTEYHCRHSDRCIPNTFLCDGENDCEDGSDEDYIRCGGTETSTSVSAGTEPFAEILEDCFGMFLCNSGECVEKSSLCNGFSDCFDGSDEGIFCDTHCVNNGGCQHECHPSPQGSYCSCHLGSHLADNGKDCLDDAECREEDCSHTCVKGRRVAVCACARGYSLQADNRTCKPEKGEDMVVVVRTGGMMVVSHTYQIKRKMVMPLDLAMDSLDADNDNHVIYADKNRGVIGMVPINLLMGEGGNMERKVFLDKRSFPQGLSYDPRNKNIYFSEFFGTTKSSEGPRVVERDIGENSTSWGHSLIMVCNMGGNCSVVTSVLDKEIPSTSLAVNHGKLFFCANFLNFEKDHAQILSSSVDGSDLTVVRERKVVRCGSVAVDEIKNRVYWTDLVLGTVESIIWDGSKHHLVQKDKVYSPVGLSLMGDWVVWINPKRHELVRCLKYNSSTCEVKHMSSTATSLVALSPPLKTDADACTSASCKHLCTSVSNTTKCLCPLGFKTATAGISGGCIELKGCRGNPCNAGSKCEALSDADFICRCSDGYSGLRCEESLVTARSTAPSPDYSFIIVVIVLVVCFAVGAGCYWYKKPFTIWKGKSGSSNQMFRFVNPAFGVMNDEAIVSGGSSSTASSPAPSQPYVVTNPSLSQNFENPFFKTDDSKVEVNTSRDSAVASITDSTSLNVTTHHVDLTSPASPEFRKRTLEGKSTEMGFSPFNPVATVTAQSFPYNTII